MIRLLKMIAAAVTVLGTMGIAAANAAVLVADGSFNDPASPGNFTTYGAGSTFGNGGVWLVTNGTVSINGSVDEIGNYWPHTPNGGNSVDLDGNSPGGISQKITFNTPGSYVLQFYLAGNPDGLPEVKSLSASIGDGSPAQTFTYDTTLASFGPWQLESMLFTISAPGSYALAFQSNDQDTPYGPVIGQVSISAVPEPATWAMMILGFLGMGFIGFRRRSAHFRMA